MNANNPTLLTERFDDRFLVVHTELRADEVVPLTELDEEVSTDREEDLEIQQDAIATKNQM